MQSSLKIVIVDENATRAAVLEDALREAGHLHVARLDEASHLIARLSGLDPDVALIDLETPSREKLEQMFEVSRAVKRPVAIFVEESDKAAYRGRNRCRRRRLHRRGAAKGPRKDQRRPVHLAVQLACPPARRTRARPRRARGAQDHRPGQGHSHESEEPPGRRRLWPAA